MYRAASSILWTVSFPVRAAWHYNSGPKIAELEQHFEQAKGSYESHVQTATNVSKECFALIHRIYETRRCLPTDHRDEMITSKRLDQPISDIQKKTATARLNLFILVQCEGPAALKELKGRRIIVGESYERIQRILEQIVVCEKEILQARAELSAQGVALITALHSAEADSAETVSFERGLYWALGVGQGALSHHSGLDAISQMGDCSSP